MRLSPIIIMLATATSVLYAAPSEAIACSCTGGWRHFPGDDATGVPLNVEPTLYLPYSLLSNTSFGLRRSGERNTIPLEVSIETRARHGDTLVKLKLHEPLSPMTTYEFLSDNVAISTFQTGLERDVQPPEPTPLKSFSVETMTNDEQHWNSCIESFDGIFARLRMGYPTLPKDAAYFLVRMRSESGADWSDDWIFLSKAWELKPLSIADQTCNPRPLTLRPNERYCASLVAVDLAGNYSDSVHELCATAKACQPGALGMEEPSELCLEITDSEDAPDDDNAGCSLVPSSRFGAGWPLLLLLLAWYRCRKRVRRASSPR